MHFLIISFSLLVGLTIACTGSSDLSSDKLESNEAKIISVEASGTDRAFSFSVGISSPDTGCDQYADWWEVLSLEGTLLYRRILAHSHVNEQPFIRSGGPITIAADRTVWIRAHMNPEGYGKQVYKGSVNDGFAQAELPVDFAIEVAGQDPLPDGCDF
ncbi:MAG: hypothetical protein ACR2MX_00150 [Cyclobacteriaceae bacterium]